MSEKNYERIYAWFAIHGEDVDYEWTSDDEEIIREGLRKIAIEKGTNPYNKDGTLKVEGFIKSKAIFGIPTLDKWIEKTNENYKQKILAESETYDNAEDLRRLLDRIDNKYRIAEEIKRIINEKIEKLIKFDIEEIEKIAKTKLERPVGKGGWKTENAKWAAYYRTKLYGLRDAYNQGVNIKNLLSDLKEEVSKSQYITQNTKNSILEQIKYLEEM